jgi:transcriptional activator SPT8
MDKEVGNRPPQPTTPIDTSTRIDTPYNISAHAQHASSAVVQAAIQRRQLFKPTPESLIQHLALDPFIVIPQPGHVHSLAVTPCMSYLLTGSEDGHVRAYDFWASANGKNFLSTQQRAMATLGEGVNKGGVVRGYWKNEVDVEEVVGDAPEQSTPAGPALPWMQAAQATQIQKEVVKVKKMQPVYSMAIQSDALWVVSGTEVSSFEHASPTHAF